jgi:hypothetical protein
MNCDRCYFIVSAKTERNRKQTAFQQIQTNGVITVPTTLEVCIPVQINNVEKLKKVPPDNSKSWTGKGHQYRTCRGATR